MRVSYQIEVTIRRSNHRHRFHDDFEVITKRFTKNTQRIQIE